MDESVPIRAIVIGVSVLLAIATISGVLMYYNTAKQMASNIGAGQDFAANYEDYITEILTNASNTVNGTNYITGTDVKNLFNYFEGNENVQINLRYNIVYKFDENYIIGTYTNGFNYDSSDYQYRFIQLLPTQKYTIKVEKNVKLNNNNTGMKITLDILSK